MSKLFLIRHGESEWNILKKIQGQEDVPLSSNGIVQAEKVAKRLLKEKIHHIYSSDLKRAYDTAKVIGSSLNIKVNKLEELREINFGSWQGLTSKEVQESHRDHHLIWMTNAHKLSISGAETLLDVQERMIKVTRELIVRHPDENLLLVSHGSAIKTLILGLLDIDLAVYNKMTIGNVSISVIEFREFNPVVRVLNDTCHLEEE